jgi:NADPH:quinone reductase-like Zn-dependent oxidoreductase
MLLQVLLAHFYASGGSTWCYCIGMFSTEQKAAHATQDKCDHAIIHTKEDFVAKVNEITGGKGVDVFYDSIGKDTLHVKIRERSFAKLLC